MAGEQFQYQSPHRPVKGTIVRYQTFRGFRSAHGGVVVDARSFETRRPVALGMRLLSAGAEASTAPAEAARTHPYAEAEPAGMLGRATLRAAGCCGRIAGRARAAGSRAERDPPRPAR